MALIPTSTAIVQSFAGALYGKQIGTVTMAAVNRDIENLGLNSTLNAYFSYSFGNETATQVATRVVTNLGITEGADNAIAYVVGVLGGKAANIWGQTISEILAAFSSMTADATYGAAATAWNSKVEAAAAYTGAADVASGTVLSTFTLTSDQDSFTGGSGDDVFNSSPAPVNYQGISIPMDSYVGDILDGGDGNDTLNIITSGGLTGIGFQSVNIENINITTKAPIGGSANTVTIDMQDVTGVEVLTAQNLRQALQLTEVQEVADIVYQGSTRDLDSSLTVTYAAEVVVGAADELNMTVDSNTAGGLVTVNGIETVNITSVDTNLFDLSAAGATVNIFGAGDLDLLSTDVTEVNNEASSDVILEAAAATTVNNAGASLTVNSVANNATVTNSGAGTLSFDVTAADTATITNSGSGDLTVVAVGLGATITNSGLGDLTVEATGATSTITNSGAGNTTIETSGATVIDSTGDGDLTVNEDAFATAAAITATGSGDLTVTVKDIDVTIDASESTGQVTLNVSAGTRNSVGFTGSAGDDKVVLGAAALVAGDLIDGGDGTDTIEMSDAALSLVTFAGVTNFETVKYTGTDAVAWTDLESLGTDVVLEFDSVGAAAAGGDTGNNGVAGTGVGVAGTNGEDGGTGVDADNVALASAAAGVSNIDLTGTAATINVVLNDDLSAVGGTGGNGGVGGAGFVGIDATATTAATAGSAGGNGGQGEMGGNGASVVTTDATTLTLTLNGVTLDSSGGTGGNGGAGAAGGAGGDGMPSGSANNNGAFGGDGGDGGDGGTGGAAEDTISATAATSVTIYSNVSDASDTNELVAAGGLGGAGGAFGLGGNGGSATASGSTPGLPGRNGTSGTAGTAGADASGLVVGDGATITVTGAGNLVLGEISQATGATAGLTINANDDDLGALTGDLTFEIAGTLDDDITGGAGANTIILNGGADTIDLSASADVADSITLNAATGTSLDFTVGAEVFDVVEITGFDLGLDTVTVADAISVENTIFELVATNTINGNPGYGVYEYSITDGVITIAKGVNDPTVSGNTDSEIANFQDVIAVIFNDIFDYSGLTATPAVVAEGESVVWTDGTDSWLFVSDGQTGYTVDADYVVKLVGVEVTDIADVLA